VKDESVWLRDLSLVFQLAEAPEELVVELLLREQFPGLTRERLLGLCKFFRE
jgi:hypothetical protein